MSPVSRNNARSGRPRRGAEAARTVSKRVIGWLVNADTATDPIQSEHWVQKADVIISTATARVRRHFEVEERSYLVFFRLHHCPQEVLLSLQCRTLSFRCNLVVWRCLSLAGSQGKTSSSRLTRSLQRNHQGTGHPDILPARCLRFTKQATERPRPMLGASQSLEYRERLGE